MIKQVVSSAYRLRLRVLDMEAPCVAVFRFRFVFGGGGRSCAWKCVGIGSGEVVARSALPTRRGRCTTCSGILFAHSGWQQGVGS